MAKKSNLITLKNTNPEFQSLTTQNQFFINRNFIETFKRACQKKGVLVTFCKTSNHLKTVEVKLELFYTSAKLKRIRKKKLKKKAAKGKKFKKGKKSKKIQKTTKRKKKYNPRSLYIIRKTFTKKLKKSKGTKSRPISKAILWKKIRNARKLRKKKYLSLRKIFTDMLPNSSTLAFSSYIINKDEKQIKNILTAYHLKFSRYKYSLFSRRPGFYFDFIKLTAYFAMRKITAQVYSDTLGNIFKFLQKRSHGKFFQFIQLVLNQLTKDQLIKNLPVENIETKNVETKNLTKSKKVKQLPMPKNILGLKVKISGKLKGKLRASQQTWNAGKLNSQTLDTEADYSYTHIKTIYGTFGLKLWVNYKKDDNLANLFDHPKQGKKDSKPLEIFPTIETKPSTRTPKDVIKSKIKIKDLIKTLPKKAKKKVLTTWEKLTTKKQRENLRARILRHMQKVKVKYILRKWPKSVERPQIVLVEENGYKIPKIITPFPTKVKKQKKEKMEKTPEKKVKTQKPKLVEDLTKKANKTTKSKSKTTSKKEKSNEISINESLEKKDIVNLNKDEINTIAKKRGRKPKVNVLELDVIVAKEDKNDNVSKDEKVIKKEVANPVDKKTKKTATPKTKTIKSNETKPKMSEKAMKNSTKDLSKKEKVIKSTASKSNKSDIKSTNEDFKDFWE